jgi:hypothetical protein
LVGPVHTELQGDADRLVRTFRPIQRQGPVGVADLGPKLPSGSRPMWRLSPRRPVRERLDHQHHRPAASAHSLRDQEPRYDSGDLLRGLADCLQPQSSGKPARGGGIRGSDQAGGSSHPVRRLTAARSRPRCLVRSVRKASPPRPNGAMLAKCGGPATFDGFARACRGTSGPEHSVFQCKWQSFSISVATC